MKPDSSYDALVADLRRLGRSLPRSVDVDGPALDDLTIAVMARLVPAPAPTSALPGPSDRHDWRRRWRRVVAAAARRRRRLLIAMAVVLLGFLGVPGVRAAVLDWFNFHGVVVRIHPGPAPTLSTIPPAPTAQPGPSLEQVRNLVGFPPVGLTELGPPRGVEVSADRRLLSLSWTDPKGGTIRLDEFDGRLDYGFAKSAPSVQWTTIAGSPALWFEEPHEVVVLDAAGNPRTETARLAGHTLIWEAPGTVLRLEGDFTLERALEIAGSAESLP